MRFQLTAILILALFSSCSKRHKNDLEKGNFKGDISQITINKYDAEIKFGEVVKSKLYQHSIFKINSAGNTYSTDQTYRYGDADSTQINNYKFTYIYDDQGNNIKTINSKDPKEFSIRKYNEDLIKEEDLFDNNKLNSKTKYIYANGVLTEVNSYDANGKFTGKDKIIKNDKGLDIELQRYKASGELDYKMLMTYDDQNNVLTEKQVGGDYPFSANYNYLNVDNRGNWLKAIRYNNGKPHMYIERIINYR